MNYSILGCGWLGFPLAKHLVKNQEVVLASTTTKEKLPQFTDSGILPFLIKIDNNKIEGDFERFLSSDVLIISVPFRMQKENFIAYKKLAALIATSSVSKVIFISSTSVYADTNSIVTEDESFNINPAKKILVDLEQLFLHHNGFDTTVIRFSGLIGGNRNPGNFFKEGRVVKNGLAPINLIHLDDCIEIIHLVSKASLKSIIFNASADTHPTRKEFYTAASIKNNKTPAKFSMGKDFEYKIISNQKLKSALNYKFKHPNLMNCLDLNNFKS